MNKQDLDAIREREAKATPGPWERWHKGMEFIGGTVEFNVGDNCIMTNNGGPNRRGQRNICPVFQDDDAEFIAHARTDIPLLLAEIDRLQDERDAMLKAMKELAKGNGSCLGCKSFVEESGYNEDICMEGFPQCEENLDCWEWEGLEGRG